MRRPSTRLLLGFGIPFLVVLLLLAGWAVDTDAAEGGSVRNVELSGWEVGRRDAEDLAEEVARFAAAFGRTPVEVHTDAATLTGSAADFGLVVDEPATAAAVLAEGRRGAWPLRPLAWLRSFVAPHEVEPRFRIRADVLALALFVKEGDTSSRPVEPEIVASPDAVGVRNGEPGRALDPAKVAQRLLAAAQAGEDPITITVEREALSPTVTDAEARELAEEAQWLTAQPLTVTVAGRSTAIDVPELRSWVGSRIGADGIELTLDEARIAVALEETIGSLEADEPVDASFTVVDGAVQIVSSRDGLRCCAPDAAARVAQGLRAGQAEVEIDAIRTEPDFTTEDAEALGIVEPVGTTVEWRGVPQVKSFTTYHDCCENRVHNIHRIADLVRGALVRPGETFSVNGHVGPRTQEKGFVVAGAIANGEHVNEVGGGVSQFATTLFNAAYHAGLPIPVYQAHSEHFSRYPRGREATMGHPQPDLQFTNDTPYGILIWTSYTDTSITVTLYSTQHAYGMQTGQSEARTGEHCTAVTTERTITYPDGSTKVDTFRARYRDPNQTSC